MTSRYPDEIAAISQNVFAVSKVKSLKKYWCRQRRFSLNVSWQLITKNDKIKATEEKGKMWTTFGRRI